MKTYNFKIYGHEYETKVIRRDDSEIVISVNGQEFKAYLPPKKKVMLAKPTPKIVRDAPVPGEATKITAKPSEVSGAGIVKAPLPGLVLKIPVKIDDSVKAGETVLVMEAMKMQNQITALTNGKVTKILVNEGDSVSEGQELVRISAG
ncbi:MAG: biotin/lipoyl-containing protein [Candidatus Electryonea clarkiae]|nr:biotin/lipoyl-containing protein [Candidatus Electryonea clarkiae]MDP8285609.1 biotin/lipoyl-containing protein [Candidatus Electryonea clarkiae]